MNINWGLLPTPELPPPTRKKHDKGVVRAAKLEAARKAFFQWMQTLHTS
jgi:hypothetical protein